MFKKFILALFVTVFSATIFISCSSDDTSGENNSSYDINPPSWTHGAWGDLMGYTSFYSFYENNFSTRQKL